MKKVICLILAFSISVNAQDVDLDNVDNLGANNPQNDTMPKYKKQTYAAFNKFEWIIGNFAAFKIFTSEASDRSVLRKFANAVRMELNYDYIDPRGTAEWKAFKKYLLELESVGKYFMELADVAIAYKITPDEYSSWKDAIKWIEAQKFIADFQNIESGFREFQKIRATTLNLADAVSKSKLGRYIDMKTGFGKADFQNKLKVLSNHLYAMRKEELNNRKKGLELFRQKINETKKYIPNPKKRKTNPFPELETIQGICADMDKILDDAEKFSNEFEALLKDLDNSSTEIGKLRKQSFDGASVLKDSAGNDSPFYWQTFRKAAGVIRESYGF